MRNLADGSGQSNSYTRRMLFTRLGIAVAWVSVCCASISAAERPPFDSCMGFMSLKKMSEHNWTPFEGKILSVNFASRTVEVGTSQKPYSFTIFVVHDTELCCEGKPGTMQQIKAGDAIRGLTKPVSGQRVAIALGYGKPLPYEVGIAMTGSVGYVYSPYARNQLPFKVGNVAPGQLVKCPYTGKMFVMPPTPVNWTHHWHGD